MFESWRIFYIGRKYLDAGVMHNIWRRSSRLVRYWAANPRDCDRTTLNPIDRIRMYLNELDDIGYGDHARAAIDYMAEPLGGKFAKIDQEASDKGTVDGEIADSACSFGVLSQMVRDAISDNEMSVSERIAIRQAARDHLKEISQLLDAGGISGGI